MLRVKLEELTPEEARMFLDLQRESMGGEAWVRDVLEGTLEVYRVPGGILGVRRLPHLFVEFLAGKGLRRSIFKTILALAPTNTPIDAFFINPRLARVCEKLGWKTVGIYMRFDDGRTTEDPADAAAGHEPEGAAASAGAVLRGPLGQDAAAPAE